MSIFNFKNLDLDEQIIESLQLSQGRPSKCDTVLKCEDGQIYLSKISLAIWSQFWKDLLKDTPNQSETVLLLPGFDKATSLEILKLLSTGEVITDCCPRSIQRIIYFVQVLIPDIDIFSFEIECKFKEEYKIITSDEISDEESDVISDEEDNKISDEESDEISDEESDEISDAEINKIPDEGRIDSLDEENDKTVEEENDKTLDEDNYKSLDDNNRKGTKKKTDLKAKDESKSDSDDHYSNKFINVEIGKTKEKRHACKYCLKYFVRKETLERHIKNIHLNKEKIECTKCNRTFASKEGLQSHMKNHDQNKFKCPQCGKAYKHKNHLSRHCYLNGHTFPSNNEVKPHPHSIKCHICNKWILDKEHHIKKYHSENSTTFLCDYENCEFKTNRRDTLYKHERVKHDMHYRDFGAISDTLELKDDLKCIDCGKKFNTKKETEEHIALEGCEDLNCPKCGKFFNVRHNLLQHIREIHDLTEQYTCPFCEKSFNQKRNQVRHSKTCKKNEKNKMKNKEDN